MHAYSDPRTRILNVGDRMAVQADTADELDEVITHYEAQGYRLASRDRRASGEHTAILRRGRA